MKGLLLNQYYSVEKSLWGYVPLALLIATVLVFFEHPVIQRLAAFAPILLMSMAALEVLKHEAKSGWNKFVLTLPVKRERIVQSHYLFFSMLALTGFLITCVAYLVAEFAFGMTPSPGYFYSVLDILGITLTLGILTYPLTYMLGTEKAELITYIGTGAGIGSFFLSAFLYQIFIQDLELVQGLNLDLLFSLSYLLMTFLLFIISYVVSIQLYKKKEF